MSVRAAQSLLASILENASTTRPLTPDALHSIISQTVSNAPIKGSPNAWDACLRREIFSTVRLFLLWQPAFGAQPVPH